MLRYANGYDLPAFSLSRSLFNTTDPFLFLWLFPDFPCSFVLLKTVFSFSWICYSFFAHLKAGRVWGWQNVFPVGARLHLLRVVLQTLWGTPEISCMLQVSVSDKDPKWRALHFFGGSSSPGRYSLLIGDFAQSHVIWLNKRDRGSPYEPARKSPSFYLREPSAWMALSV